MGSGVSGWSIVNSKYYELFTGHKMTEQSAECAAHRSQQGEKNSFGVDVQPPLPTANVTQLLQGRGGLFTPALSSSC